MNTLQLRLSLKHVKLPKLRLFTYCVKGSSIKILLHNNCPFLIVAIFKILCRFSTSTIILISQFMQSYVDEQRQNTCGSDHVNYVFFSLLLKLRLLISHFVPLVQTRLFGSVNLNICDICCPSLSVNLGHLIPHYHYYIYIHHDFTIVVLLSLDVFI